MGAHRKISLEQIVEFRHEFKTNIALWLTLSYRTGLSRSMCQKILANTVHSDNSYSPQLLTKRQVTWLAKYIRENEVNTDSFHMTLEQLSEYMNKIPERQKAQRSLSRQTEKLKRQAARKAESSVRTRKSTESKEEPWRKLLQDKADAIQPRPNPLTWWITPTHSNSDTSVENGDAQI